MKALIFNSGLGSRMGALTEDKPKCLVTLYNGESILKRQIRILSICGIHEFIITTGPFREKLVSEVQDFSLLKFTFVENKEYLTTNYIVSMNNASEYLDDDVLLLHGDLVFNEKLIAKILNSPEKNICLFNEEKTLPTKDFKGRFNNNILKEVSVDIFDADCFAFQPLYKLDKATLNEWKRAVADFVKKGIVKVYAENALNQITDRISILGMSYKEDYIDEIDNKDDYERVSSEIKLFDYKENTCNVE